MLQDEILVFYFSLSLSSIFPTRDLKRQNFQSLMAFYMTHE